jgi:hypothetical protein
MAKKRRKPHNRPRPSSSSSGAAVRTTEREAGEGSARAPQVHRSRADKKQLARERREQERKREDRARFLKIFSRLVVVSFAAAFVVFWIARPDGGSSRPATLPGELTTEAPWPANTDELPARLDELDLPAAGTTQQADADLQILVHGEAVDVPSDIGVADSVTAPLTTTDASGVVHVGSQEEHDFTLGDVFDVWGVRLSGTCLGGYCERGQDRLRVYVDGEEVTGARRDAPVGDRSVIVVTFGTEDELPDPIPATFDFP